MMKQNSIEPGLLAAFKIFTILRFGIILPATALQFFRAEYGLLHPPAIEPFPVFSWPTETLGFPLPLFYHAVEAVVIIIYLWWPTLQKLLGRFYLPVGLALATIGPILGQFVRLVWLGAYEGPIMAGTWQLIMVLFIPLILVAWQYNFKTVLVFCLSTALLDFGLTALIIGLDYRNSLAIIYPLIVMRTVLYTAVGYMISRLVAAQREQHQALAEANARLTHYATTLEQLSVSRERNRLARELHDTLAHTLSGVTVQLEAARSVIDTDPPAAGTLLDQSLVTTRTGLTETRRALQALRASPLEDLGLSLALRNLAESFAARAGLTLKLHLPEHLDDLNPAVEQCVYRIAQESLANIDRHANARHLTVELGREDQSLTLTIADDGQGFSMKATNTDNQYGLRGMKERAEMVGGDLNVESRPGQGTMVCLTVPV